MTTIAEIDNLTKAIKAIGEAHNPNHDELGHFASGSGSTSSSSAGKLPKNDNVAEPVAASTAGRAPSLKPAPAGTTHTPSGILIPKAWQNVRISTSKDSPLQAIGVDSKGKSQYLYSSKHCEKAAAEKFARLVAFKNALPRLREQISRDRTQREEAAALHLIMKTGFRVGSDRDTKAKVKAYGASTLLGKHVQVSGDTVKFDFIGKKGVHIQKEVKDAELAASLRPRIKGPEDRIFAVDDKAIRNYLGKVTPEFTPKDFRTWMGTETAYKEVQTMDAPASEKDFKAKMKQVATKVSQILGNTPDVALSAYIDPSVFSPWRAQMTGSKAIEMQELGEFLETVHFDETGNWQKEPATEIDPDDAEEPEEPTAKAILNLSEAILGLKAPPVGHPPYNANKDPKTGHWLPKGSGGTPKETKPEGKPEAKPEAVPETKPPEKKPETMAEMRKRMRAEYVQNFRRTRQSKMDAYGSKSPRIYAKIRGSEVSDITVRKAQDAINRLPTASRMNINSIELHSKAGEGFTVGNVAYKQRGGDYNGAGKVIRIFDADQYGPNSMARILGHEGGHASWSSLDPDMREEFAAACRKEGGITDYSRAYFTAAKNGSGTHLALNENWAEWCGAINKAISGTGEFLKQDYRALTLQYPKQAAIVHKMYEDIGGKLP